METRNRVLEHLQHNQPATREQTNQELTSLDNPHVAPGWNALMLQDMLLGSVFRAASGEKGTAGLTASQAEQAAPGFIREIRDAVSGHSLSDPAHRVLLDEMRVIARRVIEEMEPERLEVLMETARENARRTDPA